jgi:hypothetical protein
LECAQSNTFSDEILRCVDPSINIHPDLGKAEKPTRKDWNGSERHASGPRHQIRRQGKLADIKLTLLQHPLVSISTVL